MSEPIDLDALELRAMRFHKLNPLHECFDSSTVLALIAELRQERERADEAEAYASHALADRAEAVAALSRAEEAIARIDGEVKNFEQSDNDALCEIERHLTEYDKQKGN